MQIFSHISFTPTSVISQCIQKYDSPVQFCLPWTRRRFPISLLVKIKQTLGYYLSTKSSAHPAAPEFSLLKSYLYVMNTQIIISKTKKHTYTQNSKSSKMNFFISNKIIKTNDSCIEYIKRFLCTDVIWNICMDGYIYKVNVYYLVYFVN